MVSLRKHLSGLEETRGSAVYNDVGKSINLTVFCEGETLKMLYMHVGLAVSKLYLLTLRT